MHSFHRSRGRIFFEVLCAFGISASCVVAWMQTYAPAMLGVAGFAGLFGLVHAFDMARRRPAVAVAAGAEAPVTDDRGDLLVYLEADEPELLLASEPEPVVEPVQEAEPEVVEPVQQMEPEIVEPLELPEPVAEPVQEAEPVVVEAVHEAEPADPVGLDPDEPEYSPVAPLFEAEPFVRKQRAAFGRRRAG
jgi:hypothetical protein